MLTFRFTGAKGRMTEAETLASGMVGKQIRFEFSEEWEGLRKNAVYRAGDVTCISEGIADVDVIPERVLSKALRRLYVGVCGTDENGYVVIPTAFVPGPFIHIGASESAESEPDPEDPQWKEYLQTLAETVRFTPQELTPEQQAQVKENLGLEDCGWSDAVGQLLVELLRKAVYNQEVSETLLELEQLLGLESEPVLPDAPQEPETVWYSISCNLDHVAAQLPSNQVEQGQSCTVVLTVDEGYELDTVTVTMAGADITDAVWADGVVTIPAVTGDVVITAKAVEEQPEEEKQTFPVNMSFTNISAGNNQRTVTEGDRYVNVLIPYDNCEITVVSVTMGGQDVTEAVVIGANIVIEAVTGAVFITAVAQEVSNPIRYIAGEFSGDGGGAKITIKDESNTFRFCCVTKEPTADIPLTVIGTSPIGDLYLVAIPETASTVKVKCPGFRLGILLVAMNDGAYKTMYDASWVGNNDVTFNFTAGKYDFIALNYKRADNASFAFTDVDTSGFSIEFK